MTYQDVIDTLEKYPNLNVNLWNLKDKTELAKFEAVGMVPDFIFGKFVRAIVEEYIYSKFNALDLTINNYTFDKNPIEFIICIDFHDNIHKLVDRIIDLFPHVDDLLKYINDNNV